jgi:hypothetical protein
MFNKKWLQILTGSVGGFCLGSIAIFLFLTPKIQQGANIPEIKEHQKTIEELEVLCQSGDWRAVLTNSGADTNIDKLRDNYEAMQEFVSNPPNNYNPEFVVFQEDFQHISWCGEHIIALLEAQNVKERHEQVLEAVDLFLTEQVPQEQAPTTSPARTSQGTPNKTQPVQTISNQQ